MRTALVAWLQMRAAGGRFVMRIEDLDPGRARPEHEAGILDDLRWLGLDWDEGPDVGGAYAPYRQSERTERYEAALARLDTYPCTCSRKDLREASSAPHGPEAVYPGTCRDGPRNPERAKALRWIVPAGTSSFRDLIAGTHDEDVQSVVGDFVLRRNDGAHAYQLAVVVDDAEMAISHVLRGADLLDSTCRQIHLQRALGYPTPRYAHVPLVLGPDGRKLDKRHGDKDLGQLRAAGAEPEEVVAALARSLGLVPEGTAAVAAHELIGEFDLARLRDGAVLAQPRSS